MTLCIGILGSAATLALRPHPVVIGIAIGIFTVCVVAGILLALRRASRRIDRIVAEELTPPAAPQNHHTTWRKSA